MTGRLKRRIAITGSGGFIGRSVVSYMSAHGMDVLPLPGDVRSSATFDETYDVLIHLAGAKHQAFKTGAAQARQVNVEGTRRAIDACKRQGALLLFMSTAGVYKPVQFMPVTEAGTIEPHTPYAESKISSENDILDATRTGDLRAVILRLFNPYGPHQHADQIIGYIVGEFAQRRKPQILSPQDERDFIHVQDVAEACCAASGYDGVQGLFNLGSGSVTTVQNVYRLVSELAGRRYVEPAPQDHPRTSVYADISRIKRELGWSPRILLEDGLRHTLREEDMLAEPGS